MPLRVTQVAKEISSTGASANLRVTLVAKEISTPIVQTQELVVDIYDSNFLADFLIIPIYLNLYDEISFTDVVETFAVLYLDLYDNNVLNDYNSNTLLFHLILNASDSNDAISISDLFDFIINERLDISEDSINIVDDLLNLLTHKLIIVDVVNLDFSLNLTRNYFLNLADINFLTDRLNPFFTGNLNLDDNLSFYDYIYTKYSSILNLNDFILLEDYLNNITSGSNLINLSDQLIFKDKTATRDITMDDYIRRYLNDRTSKESEIIVLIVDSMEILDGHNESSN